MKFGSDRLLGVEHEFSLFDNADRQLDMRLLGPMLRIDGVRADPGDPHAVRCTHGSVITADGLESEIASPPVTSGPSAIDEVQAHLDVAEADLRAALGSDVRLRGFSTHLNVETDDRTARRTASRLARDWSPALMMFTQFRSSPGLLIRPRWRRLELGCEYLPTGAMAAGLVFAAAAVAVAERTRRPPSGASIHVALAPSRQRHGWCIEPDAFGADLLTLGRSCPLHTVTGRTISAQDHLEVAWLAARRQAEAMFDTAAVRVVDEMVSGARPLPIEQCAIGQPPAAVSAPSAPTLQRLPFEYSVGGVTVRASTLTWRSAVFTVSRDDRVRWLVVPGDRCRSFLADLHAGVLDEVLVSGGRRWHTVWRPSH